MTPADLRELRHALDISVTQFAAIVRVEGRTVRRLEQGAMPIPGSIEVLCELMRNPLIYAALLRLAAAHRQGT